MGVTIKSKNFSINMGYFGFNALRTKVAELTEPAIFEHYKLLASVPFSKDMRKVFFEEYDKRIEELDRRYNGKYSLILDFLYSSDCDAKISPEICKELYDLIKDYDDDVLYGYSGRPDCAMFKDFKELVKDCMDNNCNMEWW